MEVQKLCRQACRKSSQVNLRTKLSEVTIEFLVLWLVEMNQLSRDSYLAGGNENVIKNCTSKRGFRAGYSFHHQCNGWFLINGDYFFKLNKLSKDSTWKLRQNCLKVRKVFCILGQFWLCACKSCESVKKVSRSWAMSSIKFTCIIKLPVHNLKRLFKISWIFP